MLVSRKFGSWLSVGVALGVTGLTHAAGAPQLPRVLPVSEDFYPRDAWKDNEEGRVLMEFQLDEHRRPVESAVIMSDEFRLIGSGDPVFRHYDIPATTMGFAAWKVVKHPEGMRFDPSDPTEPDLKFVYRVTVIFCLEPGHCDFFVPFPNTTAIVIKMKRRVGPSKGGSD